ncbi:hypothetical protein [Streptomyces platensis]|uniref:hypothetical protein n=1 Tax=Streptomyces platensis TaxID=58346 RepID=UPI00332ECAB7
MTTTTHGGHLIDAPLEQLFPDEEGDFGVLRRAAARLEAACPPDRPPLWSWGPGELSVEITLHDGAPEEGHTTHVVFSHWALLPELVDHRGVELEVAFHIWASTLTGWLRTEKHRSPAYWRSAKGLPAPPLP